MTTKETLDDIGLEGVSEREGPARSAGPLQGRKTRNHDHRERVASGCAKDRTNQIRNNEPSVVVSNLTAKTLPNGGCQLACQLNNVPKGQPGALELFFH